MQPGLVVGLESVGGPSDVAIGPDQHPADLKVGGGTGHDVDAIRPAARGFAHVPAPEA